MPSAAVGIPAAASLIGGSMASRGAQRAAETGADAQVQAALIAAEEQRFRPVGITTRFGQSQFGFDDEGRLTSAGYTSSPEIQALQDRLSALYGSSLEQAEQARALGIPLGEAGQGLFNLGRQYLATSPEQARQQYIQEQTALLDPLRQREEDRLGSSVFARGRAGLNVGARGQPELATLAEARRLQDLQLAASAEKAAQQRTAFGAGLFDTGAGLIGRQYELQNQALAPFQTQFGLAQLLEESAQAPLNLGAQLGGRAAQAGANVGQTLLAGGTNAARSRMQGDIMGQALRYNTINDLFGNQRLIQGMFGPSISPTNIYGQGGMGTVPMLDPNAGYGSAGWNATDI
jgi:hypothetical protein